MKPFADTISGVSWPWRITLQETEPGSFSWSTVTSQIISVIQPSRAEDQRLRGRRTSAAQPQEFREAGKSSTVSAYLTVRQSFS